MIALQNKDIPADILKDSVLANIAAAYFSVGKQLERKTQCSATRGFILSTLRGGATLNQNQIARLLGLDRTVVHRAVKSLVREGLLSERKAKAGRALHLSLTPRGENYRQRLIKARKAADAKVRRELSAKERARLLSLLKRIVELKL